MRDRGKVGKTLTGSCLCGAVQFELRLPSKFCAHCHCSNCRRAHGAAFVTWAGFARDQVETTAGGDVLHRYPTDTGATRSFCGKCGSTLFYESPRWAGEIHVARANIDGEIDRAPSGHYYVDHRASWWTIMDALPRHGGDTGVEPKDSERGNLTEGHGPGSATEATIAPASSRTLTLDLAPERFAVARLGPGAELPAWVQRSSFVSVTRTPTELSVVCHESVVPASVEARRGFRCLGVRGPLDFDEIGILASLTHALAEAGISIFAFSTHDTDYLLVADETLDGAVRALTAAGHVVRR